MSPSLHDGERNFPFLAIMHKWFAGLAHRPNNSIGQVALGGVKCRTSYAYNFTAGRFLPT